MQTEDMCTFSEQWGTNLSFALGPSSLENLRRNESARLLKWRYGKYIIVLYGQFLVFCFQSLQ